MPGRRVSRQARRVSVEDFDAWAERAIGHAIETGDPSAVADALAEAERQCAAEARKTKREKSR